MTGRPLLLLDVDGVLLPVRDNTRPGGYYAPSDDFRRVTLAHWDTADEVSIWVSDRNTDRLRRLAAQFDVVWATGWNEHANEFIAPLHDLPELPFVELRWSEDLRALETSWKLPTIVDHVGDRPCVWIDDHVRPDAEHWAQNRSVPTLIAHADHRTGLDDDIVERVLRFAADPGRS